MLQARSRTASRVRSLGLAVAAFLPAFAAPAADAQQAGGAANSTAPPAPDKSGFTLFDPTPDNELRQYSPDRPGKSHTPITIDAGHISVESDIANDTWDHWTRYGLTTRSYTLVNPELRIGLTSNLEFDVTVPLYTVQATKAQAADAKGAVQRMSLEGVGDLNVGGQINLFGNDGGDQALGLVGAIKIPTAVTNLGNNMAEFMLNVPFTTTLPKGFALTVEPAFGLLRNQNKQGYQGDYQMLIDLNRAVYRDVVILSLELALDFPGDHNTGHRHTIDPEIQWMVLPWLQLDAGVFIGLSKAAPDLYSFTGLSIRY